MNYLVIALYVISFALFIYGLMGLTGPKTAAIRLPRSAWRWP
jgi:NAD(P) transhydrogenase subunit beta